MIGLRAISQGSSKILILNPKEKTQKCGYKKDFHQLKKNIICVYYNPFSIFSLREFINLPASAPLITL